VVTEREQLGEYHRGVNEFLSPDQIAGASFETKRRGGLDPDSVRSHLRAAADTVTALINERDALASDLERAELTLATVPEPTEVVELDEDALTEQLGQHAARVLAEARAAAADRISDAEAQADEIRAAAEELHAQRSIAADATAQGIRNEAELLRSSREAEANEVAASIVARAELEATELQTISSMSRSEAGEEAERIIREAEMTRRQILEDLARRRTAARRQIEQLRAGRERLLASHDTVRRALDEITEELTISMSEARAAAETAGHTVSETTIEELEAEIETARLTGLLDTGPVPVVAPRAPSNRAATSKAIPTSTPPTKSHLSSVDTSPEISDEVEQPEDVEVDAVAQVEPDTPDVGDDIADSSGEETAGSDDPAGTAEPVEPVEVVEEAGEEQSEQAAAVEDDDAQGSDEPSNDDETIDIEEASDIDEVPSIATGNLAPVVSLDQARSDVETKTHPSGGRDTSNSGNLGLVESARSGDDASEVVSPDSDVPESITPVVAAVPSGASDDDGLDNDDGPDDADEATEPADADSDADSADVDSVGDLFASLRTTTEDKADKAAKTDKVAPKKSTSKKKTTSKSKKSSTKKSKSKAKSDTGTNSAPATTIDSAEVARRIKRVLADEQSRVMSTLKGSDELPAVEALLGSDVEHVDRYWSATSAHLDGVLIVPTPLNDFVDQIRRKVADSLDGADDAESMVESMRSMYREFKTVNVEVCVERIVDGAATSAS